LPIATVGFVHLTAPTKGIRTAWIPVTLNVRAPRRLVLDYSLQAGSSVAAMLAPGSVAIPRGGDEALIRVRIGAASSAALTSCWFDPSIQCSMFAIRLGAIDHDARVGLPLGMDAIISDPPSAVPEVGIGDAGLAARDEREPERLDIPLTLSRGVDAPVRVTWALESGSAIDHVAVAAKGTTATFAPLQDSREVSVSVIPSTGLQPFETFYVKILDVEGASIGRAVGIGILSTSGLGVPNPMSKNYAGATLTQVLSASGRAGDTYDVRATSSGTTISAGAGIFGANDRAVFWPLGSSRLSDEESCATWVSQTPQQAPGVPIQQGLVLRAATTDGVTRAITVTKAVYENNFSSIDVDTWNTALAVPFRRIAEIDLSSYFQKNGGSNLPLNVCAEVVGSTLSFEVWLPDGPRPAWGDSQQGATVALPENWNYAGVGGWYVGHLPSNGSTVYANEYSGPPQAEPSI
jgi:hypothetical protein